MNTKKELLNVFFKLRNFYQKYSSFICAAMLIVVILLLLLCSCIATGFVEVSNISVGNRDNINAGNASLLIDGDYDIEHQAIASSLGKK